MTKALTTSVVEALVGLALREHESGVRRLNSAMTIECEPSVHGSGGSAEEQTADWWSTSAPPPPAVDPDRWPEREPSPPSTAHDWSRPGVDSGQADDVVSAAVVCVQVALTALAAAPMSGRAVDVAALLAASQQLHGLALRAVAEMDSSGGHLAAGASTTATWLRDAQVIGDVAARAQVRLATTLRDELHMVEQLLCAGGTTVEHARAVVAGSRGLDPKLVADSQETICTLLQNAEPQAVREQLRDRAEALNPELGRDAERRAHARRGFHADTVPNGLVYGGSSGVEDGQVFLLGLDLAVQADRTDGDTRSLRQRRHDVLLSWARQAATEHGGDASSVRDDLRTTRTHLLLTCTAETEAARAFLAGLGTPPPSGPARPGSADDVAGPSAWPWPPPPDTGSRIPAGGSFGPGALISSPALRRLVCDAAMSLAVVQDPAAAAHPAGDTSPGLRPDPTTGRRDPLYVGRAARIVTAAQWKALVLRDRHCVVKGCRRPPAHCEAHHVRHWLDGGLTDLPNLVLLCHQHHHDHHDRGCDLRHRDGRWLTSTAWKAHAPP